MKQLSSGFVSVLLSILICLSGIAAAAETQTESETNETTSQTETSETATETTTTPEVSTDTSEPTQTDNPEEITQPTEPNAEDPDDDSEGDDKDEEPADDTNPPIGKDPYTIDEESEPGYTLLKINISEKTESNVVRANIQSAFNLAHENATPEHIFKVVLPNGTFKIDTTLNIYSNTFLEMDGATLLRDFSASSSMLKAGKKDYVTYGYEGYGNITIHGGTFDGWDNEMTPSTSNLVRFGHARNILIDSVTFTDDTSSHHLELAACKDVTVTNCTFKDQYRKNNDTAEHEAIQIDALAKNCFPLYDSYDGTACRDITIQCCSFKNVTRGIGSHSVVLDKNGMFGGINLIENKFTDIDGYAIVGLCWTNAQISGNLINSCKNGILIRSMRNDLKGIYEGQFEKPHEGYNILINNNSIQADGLGIKIFGFNVTEPVNWVTDNTNETFTVPQGDFRMDGVTISENELTVSNTAISLYRTDKSSVLSNNVIYPPNSSNNTAVILTDSSTSNLIEQNTVISNSETPNKTAIANTVGSSSNTFNKNKVDGNFNTGIQISSSSNDCTVTENNIADTLLNSVYVTESKNISVNSNTIKCKFGNGINIKFGSEAKIIDGNTITANDGHGIIINESSASEILDNTIESNNCGIYSTDGTVEKIIGNAVTKSNYGIYAKNSTIDSIDRNTVEENEVYGIVTKNSQLRTTNENNVSHAKSHGICSLSSSGTVNGNTVNYSGKYGMYFDNNSTNKIFTNNFLNNASGDIYLAGTSNSKVTNLDMPTEFSAENVSYNKNVLKWNSVAGTSEYHIMRGTDGVNFIDYDTVKNNFYNDTKVTAGTTYYYKVQAIACTSMPTVYSASSNNISLKTDGLGAAGNLKLTNQNSLKFTLKWDNTVTPQYYNIYRKSNGDYIFLMSVNGSQTTFTDSTLLPNTTYTYKVQPVTYYGEDMFYGEVSDEVSATTTVPNGEILSAKAASTKKAAIIIKPATSNKGYAVYASTKKSSGYKLVTHISSDKVKNSFSVALPDNSLYVKIKGYRDAANKRYYSSFSKPLEITIAKAGKAKFSSATASKQTSKLKWSKVKNAVGYQICISTNNKTWKTLCTTSSTSYNAVNLKKGQKYYFKIRAYNLFCTKKYYSDYSSPKAVQIKAEEKKTTKKTTKTTKTTKSSKK